MWFFIVIRNPKKCVNRDTSDWIPLLFFFYFLFIGWTSAKSRLKVVCLFTLFKTKQLIRWSIKWRCKKYFINVVVISDPSKIVSVLFVKGRGIMVETHIRYSNTARWRWKEMSKVERMVLMIVNTIRYGYSNGHTTVELK